MSVDAIKMPKPVYDALQNASEKTGVDFDYLLRTAQRESGLNPKAKASTSSATGLYQFIESTWLEMVHQHGDKFGLNNLAARIQKTSNGRFEVANAQERRAILGLRNDPGLSAMMAAQLTKDNAKSLAQDLGRMPKQAELYMAHFLGAKGAAKLVTAVEKSSQTQAANLFPQAAKANPALFYKNNKPVSVAKLYENLGRNFSTQITRPQLAFQAQQIGAELGHNAALPQQVPQAPRLLSFDFDGLYSQNGARTAPQLQGANHLAFFHHFDDPTQDQQPTAVSAVPQPKSTPGLWNLYADPLKNYGE